MRKWAWVGASCRGTAHERDGLRKQDAYRCWLSSDGAKFIVATVADGAGSATHSRAGAALTTRIITSRAVAHLSDTSRLPSDDLVHEWVDEIRDRLRIAAEKRQLQLRNFATTLVALIALDSEVITIHCGDGAIAAKPYGSVVWETLSWPKQGEYASSTYFLTDDPAPALRINRHQMDLEGFALFSDGIERLALDFANQTAYQPFFGGMFAPLEKAVTYGRQISLSTALGAYLSSAAVNARTDDDKTLVLALRK